MTHGDLPSIAARAERIVAVTAAAWRIAQPSAHALARRAPHGYVPQRTWRRLGRAAGAGLPACTFLAHSW